MLNWISTLVCLLAVLVFAAPAAALPVNHGTFVGTTVSFVDVTETTQTGDDECLWTTPDANPNDGACATAPSIVGDSLLLTPTNFGATATGAGGSDTTHSLVTLMLQAQAGSTLTVLQIDEFGDAILAGAGTAATNASVSMSGTVTVEEAGGNPITPVVIPFVGTFVPTGTFDLPSDPGTTLWSGSALIDIVSVVPNATKATLSFDNVLNAFSETSSSATIQKKVGIPSIVVSVVPEPGTLVLALMGATLLVPALRRRQPAG